MDDKRKEKLKLCKLDIGGYKSFSKEKPLQVEFSDVTILLGANGAGKSNIISFFKMLNYAMSETFEKYVEEVGTAEAFLYYGSKVTRQIVGNLKFANDEDTDIYSFILSHATPDRLIFTSEIIEWSTKGKEKKPFEIKLNVSYKESALCAEQDISSKIIRRILSNCKVFQFHDTSSESRLRTPSHVEQSSYLMSEGGNLAAFLYLLKNSEKEYYDRIVSYIKLVIPQFGDFILNTFSNGYIRLAWQDNSPNDYIFTSYQLSDGSIRFIALATLLLQPPKYMPSVIIIDEPELGLHPVALTYLAEMIRSASENAQVVIATQSPQLADEFEPDNIVVVERDEDTAGTVCHRLNESELKDWLESYTISELWNKNVIGGRP